MSPTAIMVMVSFLLLSTANSSKEMAESDVSSRDCAVLVLSEQLNNRCAINKMKQVMLTFFRVLLLYEVVFGRLQNASSFIKIPRIVRFIKVADDYTSGRRSVCKPIIAQINADVAYAAAFYFEENKVTLFQFLFGQRIDHGENIARTS